MSKNNKKETIGWDIFTLKTYDIYHKIVESELENTDKDIRIVSLITGMSVNEVENMPITEYNNLLNTFKFDEDFEFEAPKLKYIIGSKEYKMTYNVGSMSTGQFFDYTNTVRDYPYNLARILCTLLVPVDCEYNENYYSFDLEDTIYNEFKYVDGVNISHFFTLLSKYLEEGFLHYSLKKNLKKLKRAYRKEKDIEKKLKLEKAIQKIQEIINQNGQI